jgi:hypothetical protein
MGPFPGPQNIHLPVKFHKNWGENLLNSGIFGDRMLEWSKPRASSLVNSLLSLPRFACFGRQ